MSQFCTQCGTENLNEAKFCKSCGYSLIEKEPSSSHEQSAIQREPLPKQDEVANVSEIVPEAENSSETPSSWNGWLLLIPVIAWVLYRLGVLADGNIVLMFGLMTIPNVVAEALGGAAAIIGIPLIVTSIIYLVKKSQNAQYINFVKHTLIASIFMLALGIAANINTIRDEQKAAAMETTLEVVDEIAPAAAASMSAEMAAIPAEVAPVLSKAEQMEKDCNNGIFGRCTDLGLKYADGRGVQKDDFQANKLFKIACDGGDASGCEYLGHSYNNGKGVQENKAVALSFYKKACERGDVGGCTTIALDYKDTSIGKTYALKGIALHKKACNNGDVDGCSGVWNYYSTGYMGVEKDMSIAQTYASKAFALNKKACNRGDALGCSMAGQDYMQGRGVPQDLILGENFLKKGCDGGDTNGCRWLGSGYECGHECGNAFEKDYTKAAQYYKKACDAGDCGSYEQFLSQGY